MYAELHCHSAYSFLDGASLPEELVFQAHRHGMKALALTDHNGLYGSMEFAKIAKAWELQPITGAEITLETKGGTETDLTLLVEDSQGYANLCRLLSEGHLAGSKGEPKIRADRLHALSKGLIILTGCCKGELARLADQGRFEEALRAAEGYREAFGRENVWIELQQNLVRGDTRRIRALVEIAKRLELGIVATNNVHYHVRERHRLQDVLVAIRNRTSLDACHQQRRPNSEFYLKSPKEMAALFAELPEAIRATELISERCQGFDLTQDVGYAFPDFSTDRKGEKADDALARVCRAALAERYRDSPLRELAEERLEKELRLVSRHGLSGFFLVYRDLLELAEEVANEVRGPSEARKLAHLPPGRGRGSSVSSLVCYLIGLSHVDPVKNNLSIDRFLNEELQVIPDIDLDFARDIREALIQRVYQHYGQDYAALVCSFVTYRLRSAVRDVGKALGLPPAELDRLARLSERAESSELEGAMRALPEFGERADAPLWRDLIALSKEISGFPRHVSQHVGGMIISSRPLVECVPLEKARMPGRVVCQWDKDSCEDARFIKVDFLALGMLSLVEECVEHIAASRGEIVDLSRISFQDEKVYDQICEGDTVGVFQIESRAQIQMLPRTRPRNLEELAIEVAIIRPGPIVGGAVHPYVSRRMQQREAAKRGEAFVVPYDHPLLEPALKETLGVILYQDQVLQVAVELAGFTPGQAESLRRALGRKRSREAVLELRDAFRMGARKKGVPDEVSDLVFDKILAFSQFGFPKSHSFAFAVLAYQSAWLRLYYPAEYAAAIFNSQPMGFYPPHVLVRDAMRHGVRILPPDVNESDVKCTATSDTVRIGLNYVKGLGTKVAQAIVEERKARGAFKSLDDLVRRVDLPRPKVEALIASGAGESWGMKRRELLWELGLTIQAERVATDAVESRPVRQMRLPLSLPRYPVTLPDMDPWDVVVSDYAATGLSTREHLISLLRPNMPRSVVSVEEAARTRHGRKVYLAGLVVARQRPETARGVLFLLLEDETGMINVVVRPDLFERRRSVIRGEKIITTVGKVQRKDGTLSLLAADVWPVDAFLADNVDVKFHGGGRFSHDFH